MPHIALRSFPALWAGERRADHDHGENCGLAMSKRQSEYATFDPEAIDALRPVIRGHRHGIVAGHYLAAQAGFAILEAGGNAIDAGCAAGIALRRRAQRPRQRRGRGAHHPLQREDRAGGDHQRARHLACRDDARSLPARARRAHPGGPAAHRRAQRAGRLDHRAGTPRHHDLRRSGARRRSGSRRDGLRHVPADGERDRQEGGELRPLAVQRRDLSAGWPPARRRRRLRAGRPRALAPVHGGRGTRRRRRPCRGPGGRARCLLPGGHRRGHRHVPSRRTAALLTADDLASFRVAVEPPERVSVGGVDVYACGPLVPRGRRCCRRSACWTWRRSRRTATTARRRCTRWPRR